MMIESWLTIVLKYVDGSRSFEDMCRYSTDVAGDVMLHESPF